MKFLDNKVFRGAVPALLIHCSIGSVYCWSLIKGDISSHMGISIGQIEWAFSLAIFCLGMSAAFGGSLVEKDVKKSSAVSAICFSLGLVLTGVSVHFKSLIGLYLSYGVLMGIGLGIGYISPVKTLMMWFKEHKGLATGIAIMGFGLAKVIASPIIIFLLERVDVIKTLYILAIGYFVMMIIGSLLIKKPTDVEEINRFPNHRNINILKKKSFIGIWLVMYINITCGLALIAQEKDIMKFIGLSAVIIGSISSLTAFFNSGGRLIYSAISDKFKNRVTIYKIMLGLSIASILMVLLTDGINNSIAFIVIILLCVVNASYGGGFSNLPTLLSDCFGMDNISKIHGLALTAWAMAGLSGNQLSAFIYSKTGSYNYILYVLLILYIVALVISFTMIKPKKKV